MSSLPAVRLRVDQPPFSGTGVDFFGPLYVNVKRSTVKRLGCIFTCKVTRVRRGRPIVIYSDNGANFTAGERELRGAVQAWDPDYIGSATDFVTSDGDSLHRLRHILAAFGRDWCSPPNGLCT